MSRWEGSMKVEVEKKTTQKQLIYQKRKKSWLIEAGSKDAARPMYRTANCCIGGCQFTLAKLWEYLCTLQSRVTPHLHGYFHLGELYSSWKRYIWSQKPWLHVQTIYQWCLNQPWKHWEKTPCGKKKGAKTEDPSPSQMSGTRSASHRGPGMIMFQSPHQSQEASQKEKGMVRNCIIYLFHCKSGTEPQTLRDVTWTVAEAGEGWWLSLTTGETVYPIGWHCFRWEKVWTVTD